MATEEKAILSVSLKEYKKQIDELRASLLSLEETDEQYAKTAKEIADKQSKLNQVMSIGKKNADALDGSYNALVNEMANLKRAWRETADEAKRADLGQRILEINNQLKDMDASIGNFQRNVGNYGGAFTEAFKKGLDGLKGFDGALGNTAGTVSKLVPLIQKATQAATTGLKGIKAALISTGIGALIVALGTIIANWDSIRDAIFGTDEAFEKLLNRHNEYEETQDRIMKSMDRESKLMAAKGKSQKEILEYQKKELQSLLATAQAERKTLEIEIERMKTHSWLYRFFMGENGQIEKGEAELKKWDATIKSLQDRLYDIGTEIEVINIKGEGGGGGSAAKQTTYIKDTLNRLKDFGKTELEILERNFNEQMALMKKEYDEQLKALNTSYKRKQITTKQYEQKLYEITALYQQATTLEMKKHQKDREKILKEIAVESTEIKERLNEAADPEKFAEEKITEIYEKEWKILYNSKLAEIKLNEDVYAQELQMAGENEEKKAEAYQKYTDKKKDIDLKYKGFWDMLEAERDENFKKLEDAKVEKKLETEEKKLKIAKDMALSNEEYSFEMSEDKSVEKTIENIKKKWEIEAEYYNAVIDMNLELLKNEHITEEERIKIEERIAQNRMKLLEATRKKNVEVKKAEVKQEKVSWKEIVQVAAQGAQALAGIMNGIAGLWQEDIKRKQEDGEISEEEARNQFERTKKVQYGAAVLNTAAGIVTAIATAQKLGPPMGPIVGAINAAAVAAAGAIQIAQIAKQTYDSAGSGGGGSSPIIIPPQATYQETNVTNPTERESIDALNETLQNQTVTVKVTDIEKVEGRKKATQAESTW